MKTTKRSRFYIQPGLKTRLGAMGYTVFISYSHQDAKLVTPVARLLRATKGMTFLDSESLEPGKKWRTQISDAIAEVNLVVVFWCLHASRSREIESEYVQAISVGKNVLPILLDSTALPTVLSEFQYVDFREVVKSAHKVSPGHKTYVIFGMTALLSIGLIALPLLSYRTVPLVDLVLNALFTILSHYSFNFFVFAVAILRVLTAIMNFRSKMRAFGEPSLATVMAKRLHSEFEKRADSEKVRA